MRPDSASKASKLKDTSASHTAAGSPIVHVGVPLETLGGQQAVAFAKSPSLGPVLQYEQLIFTIISMVSVSNVVCDAVSELLPFQRVQAFDLFFSVSR